MFLIGHDYYFIVNILQQILLDIFEINMLNGYFFFTAG